MQKAWGPSQYSSKSKLREGWAEEEGHTPPNHKISTPLKKEEEKEKEKGRGGKERKEGGKYKAFRRQFSQMSSPSQKHEF